MSARPGESMRDKLWLRGIKEGLFATLQRSQTSYRHTIFSDYQAHEETLDSGQRAEFIRSTIRDLENNLENNGRSIVRNGRIHGTRRTYAAADFHHRCADLACLSGMPEKKGIETGSPKPA